MLYLVPKAHRSPSYNVTCLQYIETSNISYIWHGTYIKLCTNYVNLNVHIWGEVLGNIHLTEFLQIKLPVYGKATPPGLPSPAPGPPGPG